METNSKENNQHFSEILFLDDDFQCISKISMFGDTEVFFKTLCTLSNEIPETDFDGFCWELYSIFAEQSNKIIAVTKTKWGMHHRVLELLQSKKYVSWWQNFRSRDWNVTTDSVLLSWYCSNALALSWPSSTNLTRVYPQSSLYWATDTAGPKIRSQNKAACKLVC